MSGSRTGPIDNLLGRVSAELRPRVREIVGLTDTFCRDHLDDEFRDICREMAAVAAAAGLPIARGKAAGWAAGVVAGVGFANFFSDPSERFHMTNEEMARRIGVSAATLQNKSKAIRDGLDITRFDPRFSSREMADKNPLAWILMVNGLAMDIRKAPRRAQEEALRLGLIPYIPGDLGPNRGRAGRAVAAKTKARARAATSAARKRAGPAQIYTLDVSLLSGQITRKFAKKNKSVVRTIQIRGDQTLEDLHEAIFTAFDRFDSHMYEFQMGKGPMDPDGPRYVLPMAADDDFGPPILGTVDLTTIDSMGLEVGRQFGYWFDFGDDWHHQIDVERIDEGPGEREYPRVVHRVGESPPQYPE